MRYERIKDHKSEEFQRLTGIKPAVFAVFYSIDEASHTDAKITKPAPVKVLVVKVFNEGFP